MGFVLHSKEAPSEAHAVSRDAQRFLEDVGDYLHLRVPPGSLLKIYHYPNRWGLWRHLNREVPSLRWRRGVCYETEAAYIVTLSGNPAGKKFQETLRHELTHYLVATHFCDIPPWIDEGLSQVMASGPPFPHLEEDLLEEIQREARRGKERGCLQLLRVPPGQNLSRSQYHISCALTYSLLSRSSEATPRCGTGIPVPHLVCAHLLLALPLFGSHAEPTHSVSRDGRARHAPGADLLSQLGNLCGGGM
jgi:hypothetical protein